MEMLCRVLDLGHVVVMAQVCVEHDREDGDAVSSPWSRSCSGDGAGLCGA